MNTPKTVKGIWIFDNSLCRHIFLTKDGKKYSTDYRRTNFTDTEILVICYKIRVLSLILDGTEYFEEEN
jgi:hypothetical protein